MENESSSSDWPLKLNGKNYHAWSFAAESWFISKDVWDYFFDPKLSIPPPKTVKVTEVNRSELPEPETAKEVDEYDDWMEKARKANAQLTFILEPSQYDYVRDFSLPSERWNALKTRYKPVEIFQCLPELEPLKFKSSSVISMAEHLGRFSGKLARLAEAGVTLTETDKVNNLLTTILDPAYSAIISTLSYYLKFSANRPSLAQCYQMLREEEQRQKLYKEASKAKPSALKEERRGQRQCWYCKQAGHVKRNCRKKAADEAAAKTSGRLNQAHQTLLRGDITLAQLQAQLTTISLTIERL